MLGKKIIFAPAKLNLFLKILGRRNDGLHNIRTGITFIDLYDKIQIEESDKTEVKYYGKFKPLKGTYDDCIVIKTLNFLKIKDKLKLKILIEKKYSSTRWFGVCIY